MIVTHKIKVDLVSPRPKEVITAVQTDTYCRKVEITVVAGGVAVEFPEDVTVRGSYRKADGTRGIYDTMPDGETKAGSVAGNVVTLSLAPQLLTAAGVAELAVQLISGETLLNVFPVAVDVAPLPGFGGKSENYYSISGLPQITAADNGKVLTVVDGMWVAAEAPEGTAGGGTVTEIDFSNFQNGSYTEVVNGEEVTHSVTFDDKGRPATVDGVTLEWPDAEEEASPVGVTLPVVEMDFTGAHTDKAAATLDNAAAAGSPVLFRFTDGGVLQYAIVFDWYFDTTTNLAVFVGNVNGGTVLIKKIDGVWAIAE